MCNNKNSKQDKFFELCKILHEKINAYRYIKGIGFENALGDYEIDEDLWQENQSLIEEFEYLTRELFDCDFYIINLTDKIKIKMFKHIGTVAYE